MLWNGWPTGVAVSWAQHHGGPFPSTVGSIHTSVGVTAARRFQRPVAYQDTPDVVLPAVLRDANPAGISRRINGTVTTERCSDERRPTDGEGGLPPVADNDQPLAGASLPADPPGSRLRRRPAGPPANREPGDPG